MFIFCSAKNVLSYTQIYKQCLILLEQMLYHGPILSGQDVYEVYQSGKQLACESTPKACQHKLPGIQGQAKLSAANACECHACRCKACHPAHLDHDR